MEIILPQLGLFFWTTVLFLTFFVILRTFAWKPILAMLKEREQSIETALQESVKAREEMEVLKSEIKSSRDEAERERANIIREANAIRDEIISKARKEAEVAAARETEKAKAQINSEKMAAITEIKNQTGALAVQIAERILRNQLQDKAAQEAFANTLVAELSNN